MSNEEKIGLPTLMKMSEADARAMLERLRWPSGTVCPHCAVVGEATRLDSADESKTRAGVWQCNACREQFTVTVGTIMEGSHLPIATWLAAIHIICSSKKSVSALQVQRQLEIGSYRTAWHLCHRIRFMLANGGDPTKLVGDVEMDEVYIGGKPRHHKPVKGFPRTSGGKKTCVAVLVQRDGPARARTLPYGVSAASVTRFAKQNVDRKNSALFTDEAKHFKKLGRTFKGGHESVNHSINEYARPGGIHSNTAESFNGLFKRAYHGAWHHISAEHLSRYLEEACFRWTHKKGTDWQRTTTALGQMEGVRLYYKKPRRQGEQGGASLVASA